MDLLEPITLVIKAPNQKIADQTVECSLDWTVRHLKRHLSDVYPSKPLENQQRIIYSGHLLQDDNSKLKDILKQYELNQTVYTVHLVCSTPSVDAFAAVDKQTEGLRNRRHATGVTAVAADSTAATEARVTTETNSVSQGSMSAPQSETAQFMPATATGTVDPTLYNYYYSMMQQGATGHPSFTAAASPNLNTLPHMAMGSIPSSFMSSAIPPQYSSPASASPWSTYFPVGMINSGSMNGGASYDHGVFGTVPSAGVATGSNLAMQASHWLTAMQQQQQLQQQLMQQQLYAGYYNSFMQQYQAAGSIRQPLIFPPGASGVGFHLPADQPAAQNVAPNMQQAAQAARPAEAQAVRMNAQGGPMLDDEDGEEANRDWLDWIYMFIRFSMLLCILYFYSTFTRFVTALFLMIVFFLYQGGWIRMHRREGVEANPNRQPQREQQREQQRAQANENLNDGQGNEVVNDAAAAAEGNEGERDPAAAAATAPAAAAPADDRLGALSLAWNFFISFFLSLAPQAPPAINAN